MKKIIALALTMIVMAVASSEGLEAKKRSSYRYPKRSYSRKYVDPTTYIVKTSDVMDIGEFDYHGVHYRMQSNGKILNEKGDQSGKFLYENQGYWVTLSNVAEGVDPNLEIVGDEIFLENSPEDSPAVGKVKWNDLKGNQYVK